MADNFAIAPALHGAEHPIDYSTRTGQNLYAQATAPLPYIFEGKNSSLPAFLQAVRDRSDASGWDDIFAITTNDHQGEQVTRNLLTQYGEITLEDVRANAVTDYIDTPVRNAQISHQIYQCLRKSITTEVNDRLVTEAEHFYIGDFPDGPSFLMTLINVYFVKTYATTTNLRLKISDAHLLIAQHEYNIDIFNTEINGYIQRLASNGETTEDLFAHLTKAYKLVPDKEFQAYIRERIDGHNDGTNILTTTQLMDRAKAKYDSLIASESWMTQDETEKQLVVLTAQLQQVQMKNKALQKQLKSGPKKNSRLSKAKPTTGAVTIRSGPSTSLRNAV